VEATEEGFWAIEGNTNDKKGVIENGGMVCKKYYNLSTTNVYFATPIWESILTLR